MDSLLYALIIVFVVLLILVIVQHFLKDKSGIIKKADQLMREKKFSDAILIYNQLILDDQKNTDFHIKLANAYFFSASYKRAIVEYEIALRDERILEPKTLIHIFKNIGISFYHTKHYPKAFFNLLTAYTKFSHDEETCYYIALIYTSQRHYKKALEFLTRAEMINPTNVEVHYLQGIVAVQLSKRDVAIRQFSLAQKLNPKDPYLNFYIGTLYKDAKDYKHAINYLKNASQNLFDMQDKMKASLVLGECYKGLGLIEGAITSLESARNNNPDLYDVQTTEMKKNILYHLGMAYAKSGDKQKAVQAWTDLKRSDQFYKDVQELTSPEMSDQALKDATQQWLALPGIRIKDIIPLNRYIAKKQFDILTLEKSINQDIQAASSTPTLIEQFHRLNIRRFRETTKKAVEQLGFRIIKEVSFNYDTDFQDGKATAFVCTLKKAKTLVIVKRHRQDVSGFVLLNAVGSAGSINIAHVVMIITSHFTDDALNVAYKNKNISLIDRRGLAGALREVMRPQK